MPGVYHQDDTGQGERGLVDALAPVHGQVLSVHSVERHMHTLRSRPYLFVDEQRVQVDPISAMSGDTRGIELFSGELTWQDLKRRLESDRRCFGFFHPALPDEPLIFVEVALTREVASEIAPLLDPEAPTGDPYTADAAVFYSINNALAGLRGISFGNFLLKQVLSDLGEELPQLRRFATLSPMPRFSEGLRMLLAGQVEDWPVSRVEQLLADQQPALRERTGLEQPCAAVERLMQQAGAADEAALAEPLTRLALLYLVEMQHPAGQCFDPVAAFHLANGAILERINPFADRSPKGMAQSHGVMVNYRYDPDQVVANHEAFVQAGRVAMSRALQKDHDKYLAGKR